MNVLVDKNIKELQDLIIKFDEPKYRAAQLKKWLNEGVKFEKMTNLPAALRVRLREECDEGFLKCIENRKSRDGSEKYLFELSDGYTIESVYLPKDYGSSVCLSTQAGCAMGCRFCASGADGFFRNLTSAEILAQIIYIKKIRHDVDHIVLMGMGEPLENYENVVKFLDLVNSEEGLNIGVRNISISTCGVTENIIRLAKDKPGITLSISLHAPTQQKRELIMPSAKKYKLVEIINAAKQYFNKTGRRIIFEYILIDNFNNGEEDADNLVDLIKCFPTHVNIIPVNKYGDFESPSLKQAHNFCAKLNKKGLSATVRKSMGSDIESACGQLRQRYLKESVH